MNRLLRFFVLWAMLVPLGWAPASHAQSADADKATARQLAVDAYGALDAEDFARAEKLFARAERLHHAPTLILGLARAQVGLGKYVEARENYIRVTREKLPPGSSDAFVRAVASARTEMEGLEAKIAWVIIEISGPSEPQVTIDGVAVPTASLGVRRAVNPGDHEVQASAPGYLPERERLSIKSGTSHGLLFELEPTPDNAASASARTTTNQAPDGPDEADPGATQRTLGFVSLGVGGAGLVLGIITGVLAMGEHSELEEQCPNEECPESQQSTIDAYETTSTLSTVGFIAGGVLAAAGIVLVLTAPSAEPAEPAAALSVGPGTVQLLLRF